MNFFWKTCSILTMAICCLLMSCSTDTQNKTSNIDRLYQEYELQPTIEKAEIYLDSLDAFIRLNISKKELIKPYLTRGVDMTIARGMLSRTSAYILPLLRLYPDLENRKDRLISLGDVMHTLRKKHASSIIYKSLSEQFPNDPLIQNKFGLIDSIAGSKDDYLGYLFDQILINPDEMGVNKAASMKYVDGAEALALVDPQDEQVPLHIYRAAEVARSMRTFPKAISLYDWLIDAYPDYEKTPTALFIKGFILEQDYQLSEEAAEIYKDFLAKYPDHDMAESAQFLLNNIGKSDEEILQSIEIQKK